jgi:hypothetical protein
MLLFLDVGLSIYGKSFLGWIKIDRCRIFFKRRLFYRDLPGFGRIHNGKRKLILSLALQNAGYRKKIAPACLATAFLRSPAHCPRIFRPFQEL